MKKLAYMFIGGVIALALAFGGYAAFAQNGTDSPAGSPADTAQTVPVQDDAPEESTDDAEAESETDSGVPVTPGDNGFFGRFSGRFGTERSAAGDEYLAGALGITVEELQGAHETALAAALEQAVEEGLLTQEQADQLLENGVAGRLHIPFFAGDTIDFEALLADALGISVDELETARREAANSRLAQLVEEGVITQEQADYMAARSAIQDYIDVDALNDAFQSIYQDAIDQALADGVITQEQADAMLENLPTFDLNGFGGKGFGPGGFGGPHGRGPGRGGLGGFGGFGFGPFGGTTPDTQTPDNTNSNDA